MVNAKKESWIGSENRILVLSESALLVFEPERSVTAAEQYAVLLFWSDLHSLKQIRRKRSVPKAITFCWEVAGPPSKTLEEQLVVEEPEAFINKLLANMEKLGADIKSNKVIYKNRSVPSKEEMESILKVVPELEKMCDENFTEETFMELMKLYQKAVEYYSALGSEDYKAWMDKITLLIKRKELKCGQ